MGAPSTAITRLDLSFSYGEFNALANLRKFIGLPVLPVLTVGQEAADFLKVLIGSYLTKIEDTRRAPRSTYSRDTYEFTTDHYDVDEHGVEEVIDEATEERYGDALRGEQIASIRGAVRVLQRLEYDIAQAVFNTTTFTGSALTTPLGTPFTSKATADPIAVFDAAHDKVSANCGEDANTLVITKKGFRAMVRTDRLEGLLKYDAGNMLLATNDGQNLNSVPEFAGGLKRLLQVENILVARGFRNTADRGQTPNLTRQWDDTMAMLCVVHDDGPEGDLENPTPQLGRTIFTKKNGEPIPGTDDGGAGSLIWDQYYENQVRGGILRPRNKRQVKILHKECGHLLTGVT